MSLIKVEIPLLTLCLIVVLLFGTFLFVFRRGVKNFIFYLTTDIPGPTLWEVVTVHAKRLLGDDFLACISELCARYNYQPWGIWVSGYYAVIISDVEDISKVMTSKTTSEKPTFIYSRIAKYIGDGLLNLNGSTYKRHRKIITPAFKKDVLEDRLPRLNADLEEFMHQLEEKANGQTVDIRELVAVQLFTSNFRILFSGSYSCPDFSEAGKTLKKVTVLVQKTSINPIGHILDRSIRKNEKDVNLFVEMIERVFADLKAVASARVQEDGKRLNHFEAMYKKSTEEGEDKLTEYEFFHEFRTLLGAGSDTTGSAVNACLYCLALYPEEQQRVYEEIISISGNSGRYLGFEDLDRAVYLDQTIKETLRLFPPIPMAARRVDEEITLNDVKIPEGSCIAMSLFSLHRNPQLYEDPLKFDPKRFSPENCAKRSKFAYVPFSGGARKCPGKVQAYTVTKMFLSYIIRNFEILPGEGLNNIEDLKVTMNMVLHLPELPLKFFRRQP